MNGAPEWVLTIIHLTIAAVAFATGLNASSARLAALRDEPALMLRALLAVLVVVPVIAVLLVKVVAPSNAVGGGILIAALAIGPVAAFRRSKKSELDLALGLDVALLVLSLIYVPIAVWLVGAAFDRELRLGVAEVAQVVLPLQLVPLLLGLALGRLAPRLTARLEKPLTLVTNLALGLIVLVVVVVVARPLLALGVRSWILIASFACLAIATGHVLGGPRAASRMVVASFSALRFPGLAIAISALAIDRGVTTVVLAYVVCSALALSAYLTVGRASHQPEQPHVPRLRSA